jgi:tetratricopeptide (TPR) repeat protein
MSYAGNPSLSSDIQTRVQGTFEQTLGLAAEGSRQEALLGCDFVLRMDPHFEPARRLQERLRNSSGSVSVDDLLAPATLAIPDPFAGAIDLPDLPGFGAAPPAGDLRSRFQALLDGRQFQELMTLAQQNQAAVGSDHELMRIASEAQERLEAAPYVNKFVNAAREAARQGKREETARAVEKIRALDPTHPAIAELTGAPATPAMPAPADPFPAGDAGHAGDAGFELSLDDTELPELTFDEPLLGYAEPAAAPSLMDPELVSAADFQTDMLAMSSGDSSGDSETDRRIKQLLDEGQTAYQAGDVQGAIDAWSRIFLIDIDHQEAARRIEQARKVKAESERQAEEVFHEGLAKLEAGDLEGAKQMFHRVLEIQPSYFAAREYLQQLEAGQVPSARPAPRHEPAAQPALPTPSDLNLETAAGELKEEILIPPDPSEVAAAERQKPKVKPVPIREGKARKTFALVGSAVLVLALAGGAFVYLNKDRLFPNSQTEDPAAAQASGEDPIARAMVLHREGKTERAISLLRRLPPDDPKYQRAQELIAEWGAAPAAAVSGAGGAGPGAVPAPAAPAIPPERLALLASARDAYQGGSYLEAVERYEVAQQKGRLDPADAELLANAKRQIEPITAQINLFEQHEWEIALRDLWRLHEADPGNRDVTRLMVDSYYNLALRDLQRMDTKQALANFREAQGLDPDDRDLQRQIAFAETYQSRSKDMLYRIYVKHLPLR